MPPLLAPFVLILALSSACSSDARSDQVGSAVEASAPQSPTVIQPVTVTTDRSRVRDDDITDVAELSSRMGANSSGDPEWISVIADLRTRSWLAARYPGDHELSDIYSVDWATENAVPFQTESLELGSYLDEPLPMLESVTKTRQLGQLVELEVILLSGEAIVRRTSDDATIASLPGGRQRGLFSIGAAVPNDPNRPWRIHSIAELILPEDSTPPTSPEATE